MTHHHSHHANEPWGDLPEGFIDRLELGAAFGTLIRDSVLDLVASLMGSPPQQIIDLGSGTGTDAVALAQYFPTARVHALDVSPQLLDRVASAARAASVEDRVSTRNVDLNGDWGSEVPQGVDLIWASLTLHHLDDTLRSLHRVRDALRPGGVFILTELTTPAEPANPPSFDWSRLLDEAGLSCVDRQEHETENTDNGLGNADASARTVWIAMRKQPDVPTDAEAVVLGGGSAGLAAAIALARSRRSVVLIDAGEPRNAPAAGAHNVLGQEGIAPLELLAKGRAEAESYGVRIVPGTATGITGSIDDFTVEVGGGAHHIRARRVILATGLIDDLPEIPGVRAGWGRTVLHCPFCHGWEVRGQRIAILSRGEVAIHQAVLFSELSDSVTVFLHEADDPSDEQWEQLAALNVSVVRPRVERLVMDGDEVRGVEIEGGQIFEADAAVIAPRFNARTEIYEALGGTPAETPFGTHIPTDPRGMTAVPGVWAAGNASDPMAMVVAATAAGVVAGAGVHGDLAMADLARAVQDRRTIAARA